MLRVQISESMSRHERFHIIEGMSLEVCGPSRSSSAKICREHYEASPNKGWCAVRKTYYCGIIHTLCYPEGRIRLF